MLVSVVSAVVRVRWFLVAVVVLAGLAGGLYLDSEDGSVDSLPAWSEIQPSLTLEESTTEDLVHERINEAREERGLEPLPVDSELQHVARAHSEDMAERGFFNHTTPDGVDPETRVERAGVECRAVGENIVTLSRSNHEEPLADDIVEAWLDSPGHLMNIVSDDWERTALGVVADDDTVYVTQKFCS